MQILDVTLDQLSGQGKRVTPRLVYENTLYFHLSVLLNTTSGKILKEDGKPIKYYGITLAGSSIGKGFSFDITRKLFPIKDETYANFMMKHLEKNLNGMQFNEEDVEKITSYLPRNKFISMEGTSEGILSAAFAQSLAHFGSLNCVSHELGDTISSSEHLALKLKELYDGEVLAKRTKSENNPNIKNITTNAMLFGSQVGFDRDSKRILLKALKSGLYRRSFIVNIDSSFEITEQKNQTDMIDITNYFKELTEQYIIDTNNCEDDYIFTSTLDYINRSTEINSELIQEANNNKVDDFKQIDSSAISIIEDLAHILAFLDMRKEVTNTDINEAYDFFKRTRATIEPIIQPDRLHIRLFDIVRLSNNKMSFHDASKYISDIPDAKTKRDEILELFRDYSYYKGYIPEITGNKIKYFLLKEPEVNTLSSIIVSLDVHDYEKYPVESFASISFVETALDFFDNERNNHSIEKLVQSTKVKSFSLSRFEESPTANKKSISGTAGHRKADCYTSGANLIAFDIDDGLELEEAISLLEHYTYLIYTTRSHQKEKNGEMQGDRFRILIPTSNTFYVDTEQYKGLYRNIADYLNIRIYDTQTLNVSRLWYTNPDTEIYTNDADLLDISALIPSTEKAELVLPNLALLQNNISDDSEYERRKLGMIKYMLTQTSSGNRAGNLYRFACFIRDLGGNAVIETEALNAMLFDPLPAREMNSMLKNRF